MTEPTYLTETRRSYDAMATGYTEALDPNLADIPFERAMLAVFADLVRTSGAGPVADLGCGPGYLTAHLNGLGVDAFGIDLSPQMIALARHRHPDLHFTVGSMTALDLPDHGLGGVLASYSTIHLPDQQLPVVFAEFARVLAPGGWLLLAFLAGDEQVHRSEAFGQPITLDYHLRRPGPVADLLTPAGFTVMARLERQPFPGETIPRAYLLAHKDPTDPNCR